MKSARTFSQERNCDYHQYCVHQHYEQCKSARQRQISYNFFPKEGLNSSVNVHPKCINAKNLNFETLAYEKFVQGKEPETESDRNFVKNYYLENVPQPTTMVNQIVKECQEQTFPLNAYNLAEGATKDYYAFQYKRREYLLAAQKRAKISSNLFVKDLKEQNSKSLDERSKWIVKIIASLQDLGQRMFNLANQNKENSAQNGKQRIFLNQKSHVNEKYLKEYKIKDIQTSKQIFEELRAKMLRKKKVLEDQKIKNEGSNLTVSQISEKGSQSSMTSQSMISAASQAENAFKEEQIINDLCNFEQLKKKWKTSDVERIKDLIVLTLANKIITKCEGQKAKQISISKQQSKSIPPKLNNGRAKTKQNKKKCTSMVKKSQTFMIPLAGKSYLSKQEQCTKEALLKSDQFQSMGLRYEKTRNFSHLFKKKEQDLKLQFSFMLPQTKTKTKENIFFSSSPRPQNSNRRKHKPDTTAHTQSFRV